MGPVHPHAGAKGVKTTPQRAASDPLTSEHASEPSISGMLRTCNACDTCMASPRARGARFFRGFFPAAACHPQRDIIVTSKGSALHRSSSLIGAARRAPRSGAWRRRVEGTRGRGRVAPHWTTRPVDRAGHPMYSQRGNQAEGRHANDRIVIVISASLRTSFRNRKRGSSCSPLLLARAGSRGT